ncbi:glutathione peroxidase [Yeosuana sp. MJ-SS3]|jgi:glutathione peroxidase|uniref:Glutathione peroxidase n=1 Tax=Gilvirhabdus luticola TaxID=3079858 RepID=A0ABU3U7R5_9FLAO|nr:glutathione peroxidase [Yeosuana sp. MJ-SS3]MDU8886346.1 glutathione peroxidase [Yeosuana sp. MJ-SS3]
MKRIIAILLLVTSFSCKHKLESQISEDVVESITKDEIINSIEDQMKKENIYQFTVKDLSGNDFDFASLKGKKIMVVNTASECGLTPQYENLQELYEVFGDQNFTIVGFPANNFGSQEPGSNEQIATFCKQNYGVTFPMMSKISVKGDDMHDVYHFLTKKDRNGFQDSEVDWNFQKYLINENGEVVRVVSPKTLPIDESIIDWIKS